MAKRRGNMATAVVVVAGLSLAGAGDARPRRQDATRATPDSIAAIDACRSLAAADARLACYDKAAGALHDAISRKDVVVLDQEQVRKTRRSLFGFALPNLAPFGLAGGKGEVQKIDAKLKAIRQAAYQVYNFELEDGAVWRNSELIDFPPNPGETIEISRAPLGGFFMKLPSGRTVRAVRVG